jgi:aspartate 1-decarboxylase
LLCTSSIKGKLSLPNNKQAFSNLIYFRPPMILTVYKSKLHRVTVTQADLNYIGSITIDEDLMDAARLVEHERVQIVNINNGERLETYVIKGERGSGVICLNGPASRKVAVGDIIIVISYCMVTPEEYKTHNPVTVHVNSSNQLTK